MKYYAVIEPGTRVIRQSGACSDKAFEAMRESPGLQGAELIETDEQIHGHYMTRAGEVLSAGEGWVFDPATEQIEPDVEVQRSAAIRAVDAAAEDARSRLLTPGAGQAMEYEEAYRQALAHQRDPDAVYPMLEADVEAGLAPTVADAAALVMQRRGEWEVLGKLIRSTRLKAKREIREATTQAGVAQIREQAIGFLSQM